MIKIRIIDNEGKDEIHTVVKATFVDNKLWFYAEGTQYYIYADDISFMQMWGE